MISSLVRACSKKAVEVEHGEETTTNKEQEYSLVQSALGFVVCRCVCRPGAHILAELRAINIDSLQKRHENFQSQWLGEAQLIKTLEYPLRKAEHQFLL